MLDADGALSQKLEAWMQMQKVWAEAFSKYQGDVVPRMVMGGGSAYQSSAVQTFMDLQNMRAVKDLGLDMGIKSPTASQK